MISLCTSSVVNIPEPAWLRMVGPLHPEEAVAYARVLDILKED